MRFVFSICILFYHSWPFAGAFGNGIFNGGYLAVDFYFIVSGYLMINSMYKHSKENEVIKSSFSFIAKKIKSLAPALIVTFVIGFCY